MRVLIEVLLVGGAGLTAVGLSAAYILRSKIRPSTPDNCRHKRWTPWVIAKKIDVHLYSEIDEGRGIPDRVDVQLTRECISCGLPQSKTVRGIDSAHNK